MSQTLFLAALLVVSPLAAAASGLPVSPGSAEGSAIADPCPTFSWALEPATSTHEIAVYRLTDGGSTSEPVLLRSLPGSVGSWTPSLDQCLPASGWYAWSLRSHGEAGPGEWSAPLLFELRTASAGDLETIVTRVLERLGARDAIALAEVPRSVGRAVGETSTQGEKPLPASSRAAAAALVKLPGEAAGYFEHGAGAGVNYGLHGTTASPSLGAAGVVGEAMVDGISQAVGVYGRAHSDAGIAGVFENTGGGLALDVRDTGGTSVLRVDSGSGSTTLEDLSADTVTVAPARDGFSLQASNSSNLFPAAFFKQTGSGALIEGQGPGSEVFRVEVDGTLKSPKLLDFDDSTYKVDPSASSRLWSLQVDDVVVPGSGGGFRINGDLWAYRMIDWNSTAFVVDPDGDSKLTRLDVVDSVSNSDDALALDDDVEVSGALTAGTWSFGCGSSYLALVTCPAGGSDGPSCDEVPVGGLCESDGECGTSQDLDNCPGGYDWYVKVAD